LGPQTMCGLDGPVSNQTRDTAMASAVRPPIPLSGSGLVSTLDKLEAKAVHEAWQGYIAGSV